MLYVSCWMLHVSCVIRCESRLRCSPHSITRRKISVFTTDDGSLSWARWLQSTLSKPISPRSILILSSHLRIRILSGLFPSGFPIKLLNAFIIFSMRYMPHSSHSPWVHHCHNIWWWEQIMELLTMHSSPASRHFITLRPNILQNTLFWNTLNRCQVTLPILIPLTYHFAYSNLNYATSTTFISPASHFSHIPLYLIPFFYSISPTLHRTELYP
jgi:hypothetical protein